MSFPNMFLTIATMLSSCAFASQLPKDLNVTFEARDQNSVSDIAVKQWLAHVGYLVVNPSKVTITANEKTRTYEIPAETKLVSISADGTTALLQRSDKKLAFANVATGEVKNSELPYSDVLKRWTVGDMDPGRRVHLLALHGYGSERDKALLDRRVYYGVLADTYKEDKKVSLYNMDGSLKFSCDFSGLGDRLANKVDNRFEFVNQAGPLLNSADKSMIDFVIHNTDYLAHIDSWSSYYSVQKRTNGREVLLSGFCK
jgi:hypothetical protein